MNLVVDASSVINLQRAGLLQNVLGLTAFGTTFHVGSIVRDECTGLQELLDKLAVDGLLHLHTDEGTSTEAFASILDLYDLGLGETECITLAKALNFEICTDDKAARKAAVTEIGENRVIGSIRLLRDCVEKGLLTSVQAFTGYEAMKGCGAFLPCIEPNYFEI